MPDSDEVHYSTSSEEEISLRWRRSILHLSSNLQSAATQRSDLAPILMEALNHALVELFERGNDHYLDELEEWLSYEEQSATRGRDRVERRVGRERRESERRSTTRHANP